jgi:hypothetical protein
VQEAGWARGKPRAYGHGIVRLRTPPAEPLCVKRMWITIGGSQ